jgi:[ribosomal protein S5]-alanine N-acetyltransferase
MRPLAALSVQGQNGFKADNFGRSNIDVLFSNLPTIEHPEVTVRPIEANDLAIWSDYLRDPRVFEHTSWNLQAESELEKYVWEAQSQTPDSLLRLAIACVHTNRLVGTFGFHTVNGVHKSAELAFDVAPTHWGRGIATSVVHTSTRWAHASAGVIRVQATVLQSNARSSAVLERNGFLKEGLLRSYRQVRGRSGDFWMYAHVEDVTPA